MTPHFLSNEADRYWSTAGETYNDVVGRTTVQGTGRLVDMVHELAPFTYSSRALDVAAGGGSLTVKVKEKSPSTEVLATDIAPGMLAQIDKFNLEGVSTQVEDAVTLSGLQDASFTHGLSSFAIQFTPDPTACVTSLYRVMQPGGAVGLAIWGPVWEIEEAHIKACKNLNPQYAYQAPLATGAWRDEATHKIKLIEAGFIDVRTDLMKMTFECGGVDGACDYWFRSTNPVPGKCLSDWVASGGSREQLETEFRRAVQRIYEDHGAIYIVSCNCACSLLTRSLKAIGRCARCWEETSLGW